MPIRSDNYHNFINAEILALPSYLESSKIMSFTYRYMANDGRPSENIFAFASLRPYNILDEGNGVQIMACQNKNHLYDERFFNQIEMIVAEGAECDMAPFDYLWFSTHDIDPLMCERILANIDEFVLNEGSQYVKNIHL